MNPKTITAAIVAGQHRQSDAARIAELERRVAALERAIQPARQLHNIHLAVTALMADGVARDRRDIAATLGYSVEYISHALTRACQVGDLVRIRRGVYQRSGQ